MPVRLVEPTPNTSRHATHGLIPPSTPDRHRSDNHGGVSQGRFPAESQKVLTLERALLAAVAVKPKLAKLMRRGVAIQAGFLLLALTGCVSQNVKPVATADDGDHVCIIRNVEVNPDFLTAYRESIESRGFVTSVVNAKNTDCDLVTTYVAHYGVHWGLYLARADLQVFRSGNLVGRAQYKAPRAAPNKHGRVVEKIDQLVGELLPK